MSHIYDYAIENKLPETIKEEKNTEYVAWQYGSYEFARKPFGLLRWSPPLYRSLSTIVSASQLLLRQPVERQLRQS